MYHTNAQWKKYSFSQSKMGSPFGLILEADDSLKAVAIANECYTLVDSFNMLFSDYEPDSELSRLSATAGIANLQAVSPALWDIILRSQRAYQKSEGAFDITIGPLSLLWRKARKNKVFPIADSVREKRNRVGFKKLVIDNRQQKIRLPISGMRFDLGGIAQGYIAQQVIDLITQRGITSALVDAGGDIVMSNAPNGTKGWVIGLNIPEATDQFLPRKLLLQNIAVTTSGDAYQYFEHKGTKYSHIIDPRSGYGMTSRRNVTVIAANGTDADWLATACSILPIATAKKLATSMGAELLITELNKGKIAYHSTQGFTTYWKR